MLKNARLKKGLTQTELAKKMGFKTPQFIFLMESDHSKVPLAKIKRLCKVLDIPKRLVLAPMIEDFLDKLTRATK